MTYQVLRQHIANTLAERYRVFEHFDFSSTATWSEIYTCTKNILDYMLMTRADVISSYHIDMTHKYDGEPAKGISVEVSLWTGLSTVPDSFVIFAIPSKAAKQDLIAAYDRAMKGVV